MQKLMRSLSGLTLALTVLFTAAPTPAMAAGYTVQVNGRALSNLTPAMRAGQLMVPVRPFIEALGGTVSWNSATQMVTVGYRGTYVALYIGNTLVFQDGQRLWAPVAPYVLNGQTMVPAWWLAARLGATLSYSNNTLYVKLSAPKPNSSLANPGYYFPFPAGASYTDYFDGMGDPRYFDGQNFAHEGIDILAPKGTPIVSVASGTVVRYGWNTLGGYRLTIQLDDQPAYKFYYAHMDRYSPVLYPGAHVKAGQVIGWVGNTGEGPERTEGKFETHLHFGVYDANWKAINPYQLLRYWEGHKISVN